MIGLCVLCPLVALLVPVQLSQPRSHLEIACSAGQFLHGDTCLPCGPQTFMPDHNHQHRNCINCKKPTPGSPEVVLKECTSTSDTKLGCIQGYYRMERGLPHQWVCLKRADCSPRDGSELQTGDNSDDPLSCPRVDMTSDTPNGDQLVCKAVTSQEVHGGDISIQCHRGHYLTVSDTGIPSCLPCGDGTFMPDDLHSFQTCRACAELEVGPHEVLVNCTITRDTTLTCEKGHYRTLPDTQLDAACLPCSICGPERPFVSQPCETHSDTLCCPEENMQALRDAKGVYICAPSPESTRIHTGVCPAGTYLDYDRGLANCVPCGSGSFMPVGNHVNMNCKKCSQAQNSMHEVEVEPCTATTDSVIICQEGYFLNNHRDELAADSREDRHDYNGCQKCTVCDELQMNKFVGRNCSLDADTICCPEPYMAVGLDDRGTVQCQAATSSSEVVIRCSRGYFLQLSPFGKPSCEDCPNGTFIDVDNHSLQQCKPCSQAEEFNMEIEVEQCTNTSDALVLCAEGHYRQQSRRDPGDPLLGVCTPCRDCRYEPRDKYQARECLNYTDTVCCPENNMDFEEYGNGTYICTFPVGHGNRRGNISAQNVDHKRDGSCVSGEYPLFCILNTTDVVCRSCSVESNTTRNARVLDFCWNGSESGMALPHSGRIPTAVPRHGACRVGEYMYVLQRSLYIKGDILCTWCEDGTFVAEDYHNMSECTPCSVKADKAVMKNCTRTSDTKFTNTSDGSIPGNEHPLTTTLFLFIGAVLSTINGIRVLFQHLEPGVSLTVVSGHGSAWRYPNGFIKRHCQQPKPTPNETLVAQLSVFI